METEAVIFAHNRSQGRRMFWLSPSNTFLISGRFCEVKMSLILTLQRLDFSRCSSLTVRCAHGLGWSTNLEEVRSFRVANRLIVQFRSVFMEKRGRAHVLAHPSPHLHKSSSQLTPQTGTLLVGFHVSTLKQAVFFPSKSGFGGEPFRQPQREVNKSNKTTKTKEKEKK